MASEKSTYTYEGLTGWKSLRPLRLFRGMYYDVKRRLPDAFTYRTVASIIRMYFVKYVFIPALVLVPFKGSS